MQGVFRRPEIALCALTLASAAWAQDPPPDKRAYTLFNPTPRELLRELSADRPDATESPITVDAGHLQIEASFFDYTYDDDGGVRTKTWTVMDTNVKLGLTHSLDLQLVFGSYTRERTTAGGASQTRDGFGELQLRLKANLWGNDAGATAFGVMPFVKLPTGGELGNDHVEGGLIAMFGWDKADNWGIGLQAEVGGVHDAAQDDYDLEFSHTAVLGFDAGPLGAYVEYVGIVGAEDDSGYDIILSGGITHGLNADTRLDLGAQFGLTDDTSDIRLFTGLTFRF